LRRELFNRRDNGGITRLRNAAFEHFRSQKVGNEGVITVEEAKSLETELDVVEGMQFDRGYISPYFVTNAEKMRAEICIALARKSPISRSPLAEMAPTCAISSLEVTFLEFFFRPSRPPVDALQVQVHGITNVLAPGSRKMIGFG
jgi:hypothetical protein